MKITKRNIITDTENKLVVTSGEKKETSESCSYSPRPTLNMPAAQFVLYVWRVWARKSLSLALNICSYMEQWVSTFSGSGTLCRPGWGEAEMNQAQWLTASYHQQGVDQLIFKVNANVKCFLLYSPLILQQTVVLFFFFFSFTVLFNNVLKPPAVKLIFYTHFCFHITIIAVVEKVRSRLPKTNFTLKSLG